MSKLGENFPLIACLVAGLGVGWGACEGLRVKPKSDSIDLLHIKLDAEKDKAAEWKKKFDNCTKPVEPRQLSVLPPIFDRSVNYFAKPESKHPRWLQAIAITQNPGLAVLASTALEENYSRGWVRLTASGEGDASNAIGLLVVHEKGRKSFEYLEPATNSRSGLIVAVPETSKGDELLFIASTKIRLKEDELRQSFLIERVDGP